MSRYELWNHMIGTQASFIRLLVIEVSNDGNKGLWQVVNRHNDKKEDLNAKFVTHKWSINAKIDSASHIRLHQTWKHHWGYDHFCLYSLDVFKQLSSRHTWHQFDALMHYTPCLTIKPVKGKRTCESGRNLLDSSLEVALILAWNMSLETYVSARLGSDDSEILVVRGSTMFAFLPVSPDLDQECGRVLRTSFGCYHDMLNDFHRLLS